MSSKLSRTSSINHGSGNPGPFLARIVSHLDTTYMGGLEVEILYLTEEGNNTEAAGQTTQVKYLPGFYGVTPFNGTTANEGFSNSQQSYGMWAVPPDIGNLVLVIFVEGNHDNGYWIGCVPDEYMNFQIPGRAGTTFNSEDKTKRLPVGEYNKKLPKHKGQDTTKFIKPCDMDACAVLKTSGLIEDHIRGLSSSTVRRELPSMVFGMSTPGPYDRRKGAPKTGYGNAGSKTQIATSRLGGSSFVMDVGDASYLRKGHAGTTASDYASVEEQEKTGDPTIPQNELIRLKTRTGHQILLHNSEDLIYIGNAKGTTWIELTSNGKIDIYAKDSVSVHTENDYNVTADRDINFTAARDINFTAGIDIRQNAGKDFDIKAGNDIRQTCEFDWQINAGYDGKITVAKSLHLKSKHHLETADKIDMNGPTAATAATAETANLPFRSPQAEPWAGHENYDPAEHTPEKTDNIASNSSTDVANGGNKKTSNIVQPKDTKAKGTTSPTVLKTVKTSNQQATDNDTTKKLCKVSTTTSGKGTPDNQQVGPT